MDWVKPIYKSAAKRAARRILLAGCARVDTGKVRFIFSRNTLDVAGFVLARCVGDDKAFAAIELLFNQPDKWAFVDKPLEPLIAAMRPTCLTHDQAMVRLGSIESRLRRSPSASERPMRSR